MKKKRDIPIGSFVKRIEVLARSRGADAGMVEKVGRRDPYRILVSCVLSLRTKDELTEKKSLELWRHASTPEDMVRLGPERLSKIIYPVGFYRRKAGQIIRFSSIILEEHGGRVPDTLEGLLALPGVGRKTANLVVSAGFDKPGICVDTHVHRITNRWGYVRTRTPGETEAALRRKLPRRLWKKINALLVFFGKTLCTPLSPRCSGCPLARECPAVGVGRKR
jgi:endonuclease-3